jgi:Family of unknown function (DUF6529)
VTRRPAVLAVPLGLGALTALALGLYSAIHEPTGRDFVLTGFDSTASWKSALASVTVFLMLVQLALGLRITGRFGPRRPPPPWAADAHRLIGTVAFGISIPVVFHCIWALGYQGGNSRVVLHSVFGFIAYGSYVAKILTARAEAPPERSLAVLGSLLGFAMLAAWWSSALVFYAGTSAS